MGLKQMAGDKAQVRNDDGKRNNLTRQPLKGKKVQGGLRVGEMERDSLLAHGTAFMLKERLVNLSDSYIARTCTKCESFGNVVGTGSEKEFECRKCGDGNNVEAVMI